MTLQLVRVYQIDGFSADSQPLPPVIVHDEELAKFVIDVRRRFQENHDLPVEESVLTSYMRMEDVRDPNAIPGHPSAA